MCSSDEGAVRTAAAARADLLKPPSLLQQVRLLLSRRKPVATDCVDRVAEETYLRRQALVYMRPLRSLATSDGMLTFDQLLWHEVCAAISIVSLFVAFVYSAANITMSRRKPTNDLAAVEAAMLRSEARLARTEQEIALARSKPIEPRIN
jgi:hypothetical protein